MAGIDKIAAMEIPDSRGNSTLRGSAITKSGIVGVAAGTSGTSTGGTGERYTGRGAYSNIGC